MMDGEGESNTSAFPVGSGTILDSSGDQAQATTEKTTETPPADGTSPSAEPKPGEEKPAEEKPAEEAKPDPDAEARATARAVVPEAAAGYAINVPDNLKAIIGDAAGDPVIAAVRDHYKATGRTQGEMDDLFGTLAELQTKGFLPEPVDFAAELVKLGENGPARRQEVETFARSLKERGDIDEGEFTELMSLAPTAKGVTLIEKLRKMTGANGDIKPPTEGGAADGETEAQKEAMTMSRDPKYGRDRQFTADADKKWIEAFGK